MSNSIFLVMFMGSFSGKSLDRSKLLRKTHQRKNNTFLTTTDRNGGYSISKFEFVPGKKLRSTENAYIPFIHLSSLLLSSMALDPHK